MPKNYNKATGYKPENHNGKLFRVRDKDHGDGKPVTIWGDELDHSDANKLKELVVGQGKSTTARVEPMEMPAKPNWVKNAVVVLPATPTLGMPTTTGPKTVGPNGLVTPTTKPSRDPQLAAVHARALAAGAGPARAAQQRADAAAAAAAATLPVPAIVTPTEDAELDDLDAELEGDGGDFDADDLAAAADAANEDFAVIDGKGEALYKAFLQAVAHPQALEVAKAMAEIGDEYAETLTKVVGQPHTAGEWSKEDEQTRADYRFEAAAGDGKRIQFVVAVDAAENDKLGKAGPMADVVKALAQALAPQEDAPQETPSTEPPAAS